MAIEDSPKVSRFSSVEEARKLLTGNDRWKNDKTLAAEREQWKEDWNKNSNSFFGMNPGTLVAGMALLSGAGIGSSLLGSGAAAAGGAASGGTASGLAGTLGMTPGAAATALNSGALNTGMSLLRGQNIGDSLKQGATAALMSPVASYAGQGTASLLGNSGLSPTVIKGMANVAGNAASGGAGSLLRGTDLMTGIRNGAVNGLVSSIGGSVGNATKGAVSSLGQPVANAASYIANQGTQSLLRGKQPNAQKIATNALYNFGTNSLFNRS